MEESNMATDQHGAACVCCISRHVTGVTVRLIEDKHRLRGTGVNSVITDLYRIALLCW